MPTLILVRHGQSEWNLANRFTGWWDVGLTEKGIAEARAAGELLARHPDMLPVRAFTSFETRAIRTPSRTGNLRPAESRKRRTGA